jgi:hypothetical protein
VQRLNCGTRAALHAARGIARSLHSGAPTERLRARARPLPRDFRSPVPTAAPVTACPTRLPEVAGAVRRRFPAPLRTGLDTARAERTPFSLSGGGLLSEAWDLADSVYKV